MHLSSKQVWNGVCLQFTGIDRYLHSVRQRLSGHCVSAVVRLVTGEVTGSLIAWAIGTVSLFLAVVATRLRRALD